jgi:hypothetical protein
MMRIIGLPSMMEGNRLISSSQVWESRLMHDSKGLLDGLFYAKDGVLAELDDD